MEMTQVRPAAADAVSAGAAGVSQPGNGHPLPDLSVGDVGTHLHDAADALVARHERRVRPDRPVAVRSVYVRVAQPAGLDLYEHLPG